MSLEEVLRQAADLTILDEQEWIQVFAGRYQDRAVIFDTEVQRERAFLGKWR